MKMKKIIIHISVFFLCMFVLFINKINIYGLTTDYDKGRMADSLSSYMGEMRVSATSISNKFVVKQTNPLDEPFFNVKASYYSENEETDVKGYENKTALGQNLFDGVIAVPNEIPLYSLFLIENELGEKKVYIALDRGNPKYVKMFTDTNYRMKLDVYMPNTSIEELYNMGIDNVKSKILRLGAGDMDDFEENKAFIKMLNNKLKNNESIYDYFTKTEYIPIKEGVCSLLD